MNIEKHDPWALLREATAYLDDVVRSAPEKWKWTDEQREAHDLMRRIDAALAEHDAVPPGEEKVEWRQRGRYTYVAEVGLFHLSTFFESGEAVWLAEASGTKHTLDEAQRAALSAARGMR